MNLLPHEKEIADYEETIKKVREKSAGEHALLSSSEIEQLEEKLQRLKQQVYTNLSPWQRVAICRHPERPHALDFIKNICEKFTEIAGDRVYRDDPALIAGFGTIQGKKFLILGQEKGSDTESRLQRNFGMMHPEGYRKALRAMRLAEKFGIPVLSLIDTPGAYPGLTAEERGQGWAIAQNLMEMASLKTAIIVVLIGEGCSGGALGIGVGDVVGMLQHAYYSVISPEGCASILWKDSSKNSLAAEVLKMHAEELIRMQVIDEIIEEPLGGAHHNPAFVYQRTVHFILQQLEKLKQLSIENLLEQRYQRFRKLGSCHKKE